MKKQLFTTMGLCLISTAASAGTISVVSAPTTDVVASGVPDATSFTRVFTDGERTDGNEGRGNEIVSDTGDNADLTGLQMTSVVVRKDDAQDFTNSTAFLTLYVFEGTETQWDAGDGQADGDLFDGTGITTSYTETFALTGNYAEGDYISLDLAAPIVMTADMGFFLNLDAGDSGETFFQIAQRSNAPAAVVAAEGIQYRAADSGHSITTSPLEYYVVAVPEPSSLALLGLGGLCMLRRRRGA